MSTWQAGPMPVGGDVGLTEEGEMMMMNTRKKVKKELAGT